MSETLIIDPDLKALLQPLRADELASLEASILAEGCRDALVAWRSLAGPVLVDGHNRFDICTRHEIAYRVESRDFASREAAADWMDDNQLGRRNLTPDGFALVLGRKFNRAKKAQNDGGTGTPKRPAPASEPTVAQSEPRLLAPTGNEPAPRGTAEALAVKHGVSRETVKRAGDFAAAADRLGVAADIVQGNLAVTRREVVEAAKALPEDASHEKVAEVAETLRKPHVANNSGQNEWYTPRHIIEAARVAMGGFDLDPASCEVANRQVRADVYYTAEDDGLSKPWHGRVWLNPPYAQPLMGLFVEAVCSAVAGGYVDQACVIVNNGTETAAGQKLLESADEVCFLRGRVKFLDETGEPKNTPLQGQMVAYFGERRAEFCAAFSALGVVLHGK